MRTREASPEQARWAIAAVFFVSGAMFASWVSRIPAIATATHAQNGTLGLALLAPAVGALATMPKVGRSLGHRSSRSFCVASTVGLAGALVLPALAPSVIVLAGSLLLVGSANATLDVAMNAHGVSVERRLGRPILSSLHAAWSFGGFAGAGLGALAAQDGIAPRAISPPSPRPSIALQPGSPAGNFIPNGLRGSGCVRGIRADGRLSGQRSGRAR